MQFSKEYFEDEVREGFYVSGMMKRVWAAQLEVLEEVAKVCEKHKIRWFADCGTLLGAVRHNGYIPWDDDLDICMLRDDYIRFIKIAKQELPSGYWVINFHTEEFWEMLTREFDSCILEKVLAGRIKPAFFVSNILFYCIVFYCNV